MIRSLKGRIHFAHVRNLKFISPTNFEESAHLSSDGTIDMYEIVKALYETGFDGPIRPDHGRMIWGEVAMPGYEHVQSEFCPQVLCRINRNQA